MKLIFVLLNVFFISFLFVVTTSRDLEIPMIVAVIESIDKPSNVIANVCWKSSMKKILMTKLFQLNKPKSIKFNFSGSSKDDVTKENIIYLFDLRCPAATGLLLQANSSQSLGKPYRWFFIRNDTFDEAPSELEDLLILPDSEVYVAKYNGNNSYDINLVYKIKRHSDWIVENYGVWSTSAGLIKTKLTEVTATMRRKNLARETIVTSMVVTDKSTVADLDILRYPEIDAVTKSTYHHLSALYHFMNASRSILVADTWGYPVNGTWDGMLGHMVQEKAELLGATIFITKQRMSVIEFLISPTPLYVKIVFREPPLSYQSNLYLLPFKATVWYCLLVLVAIFVVSLYVSAYWEAKKKKRNEVNTDTTTLIPNVGEVSVFVMSSISQQGSTVELKGPLGRFVILLILMVCLLLYTAYSASVVVLLQASSSQIRTLTDLLNSKLEVGSDDTPYNRFFMSTEKEPIRKMIYDKKIAPPGTKPKFFNLVEGVRRLQTKPFAFNCNLGAAYKVVEKYFYEHEKCGLHEISYISDNAPWQACRKGSPYTEIFKVGLLRNAESGLNARTNHIMFSKRPVCGARGGSFVSVSLADCRPALLLLLYGALLAAALLLAEILHHRRTKRAAQKPNL